MTFSDFYFSWWLHPGATRSVQVDGLERTYVVHLPKGHDGTTPLPVVLAYHGATMNGAMMAWFTGLCDKADAAGFIAVFPDGTGAKSSFWWNAGNCGGPAMRNNVDDVGFTRALLDDLRQSHPVDSEKVYATGISNGALMAYRLAAELSERIAAIAPVAGSVGTDSVRPSRPVPVLHLHGTADEFTPFGGGRGAKSISRTDFRSVEESIETWVKINGCDEHPARDVLSQPGDELRVTRTTYGSGTNGSEVVLIVIEGGGHTWPGMNSHLAMLGPSAMNISANDLIWEFFQKHPLP